MTWPTSMRGNWFLPDQVIPKQKWSTTGSTISATTTMHNQSCCHAAKGNSSNAGSSQQSSKALTLAKALQTIQYEDLKSSWSCAMGLPGWLLDASQTWPSQTTEQGRGAKTAQSQSWWHQQRVASNLGLQQFSSTPLTGSQGQHLTPKQARKDTSDTRPTSHLGEGFPEERASTTWHPGRGNVSKRGPLYVSYQLPQEPRWITGKLHSTPTRLWSMSIIVHRDASQTIGQTSSRHQNRWSDG